MVSIIQQNDSFGFVIDEVDNWPEYYRYINKLIQNVRRISAERERTGAVGNNKILDLVDFSSKLPDSVYYLLRSLFTRLRLMVCIMGIISPRL